MLGTNLRTYPAISVLLLGVAYVTFVGQIIYGDVDTRGANNSSSWADANSSVKPVEEILQPESDSLTWYVAPKVSLIYNGPASDIGVYENTEAPPRNVYYISPKGNNDNDGLSPETPWRNISKVNSMKFNPGDSILFERGGIWKEQLKVSSAGNSTHPITFGAYGIGDKPIISGGGVIDHAVSCGSGKDHIVFRNLDVRNAKLRGFSIYSNSVTIDNCVARNNSVYGIVLGSKDEFTVTNCEVYGSKKYGIVMWDGSRAIIDNCTIYDIYGSKEDIYSGIGIVFNEYSNVRISNCIIHDNAANAPVWGEVHGIYSSSVTDNVVIENNTIYNQHNGHGIAFRSNNGVIRYNHIYGGDDAGIIVDGQSDGGTVDICHNVIHDNKFGILLYSWRFNPLTKVNIYNNVLYNNLDMRYSNAEPRELKINVDVNTLRIKNNIIYRNKTNYYAIRFVAQSNMDMDNNCILASRIGHYGGIRTFTFSEWQNATTGDSHSINADPLFVDAPNNNFKLQSDSPCIDAGTDVGLKQDFAGNLRPQDGNGDGIAEFDIGAYEYIENTKGVSFTCFVD
jgi:parallel beta-helix repeat protein